MRLPHWFRRKRRNAITNGTVTITGVSPGSVAEQLLFEARRARSR